MKELLRRLYNTWTYSDSQPTEITLATALAILAPIAISIEIKCIPLFNLALIAAGLYQLRCIVTCDIDCRIRAAFITSSFYLSSLLLYLTTIGLPTPSHWGWLLLTYSSFSTMNRLKTEKARRNADK